MISPVQTATANTQNKAAAATFEDMDSKPRKQTPAAHETGSLKRAVVSARRGGPRAVVVVADENGKLEDSSGQKFSEVEGVAAGRTLDYIGKLEPHR